MKRDLGLVVSGMIATVGTVSLFFGGEVAGAHDSEISACNRSAAITTEIVNTVGKSCDQIRTSDLRTIQRFSIYGDEVKTLRGHDFAGFLYLKDLSLANNALTELPDDLLEYLPSLEEIDLRNNGLKWIDEDFFESAERLQEIELSRNQLTELREGSFEGLHWLEELNLSRNRIERLPSEIFKGLYQLEELDLGRNELRELDPEVFSEMERLSRIDLSYNKLNSLPRGVFTRLGKLSSVNLCGNPLSEEAGARLKEELGDRLYFGETCTSQEE